MTASVDTLPLARRITEHAYRAGASLVTTLFTDDESTLLRYRYAPDASFDHAAKWLYDGMADGLQERRCAARHRRRQSRICSRTRIPTRWAAPIAPSRRPIARRSSSSRATKSTGPSSPAPRLHGPRPCSPTTRQTRRWPSCGHAIFATTRINTADPVSAWKAHDAELAQARRIPE